MIPAVLFLYFACLAPAVSFGTISSEITNGSIGVVEFLLGSGVAGVVSGFFRHKCVHPAAVALTREMLVTPFPTLE